MPADHFDAAKTWYICPRCGARVGPDEVHRAADGKWTIVGCDKCAANGHGIVHLDDWK